MNAQTKRLLAEFVGTAMVVAVTAGALLIQKGTQGELGLVGIGLLAGLAVLTLTYALGHISGAHFNPAVTIAFTLVQKFPARLAVSYVIAQVLGAIAGIGILKALLADVVGAPSVGAVRMTLPVLQGLGGEIFIAFILMVVVMGVATDRRAADPAAAGLPIGITIAMLTILAHPITGAGLNPARAFAPAVWTQDWTLQWVYWIGPIVGATLGALFYEFVRTAEAPKSAEYGVLGPIPPAR